MTGSLRSRALAVILVVGLALGGCTRRGAIAYGVIAVGATAVAIVSSCPEQSGLEIEPCARGVAAGFAIGFGIAAIVSLLVGSSGRARSEPLGHAAFSCARSPTDGTRGVCGRGIDACALLRSEANAGGDDLGPCEMAASAYCFDLIGDAEACYPTPSACAAVRTTKRIDECAARN